MKVLLDTNVFISYLLDLEKDEKLQYVVEAGFKGEYIPVLPQEVFDELKRKLATKPYLVKHIPKQASERFITALSFVVEGIPTITEPIPEVSRDKQDDYLLAYGAVGEADFLVSGDEDVQVLKQVGKLKIVSPAEFYDVLKKK